jgi:hypothetical protein
MINNSIFEGHYSLLDDQVLPVGRSIVGFGSSLEGFGSPAEGWRRGRVDFGSSLEGFGSPTEGSGEGVGWASAGVWGASKTANRQIIKSGLGVSKPDFAFCSVTTGVSFSAGM